MIAPSIYVYILILNYNSSNETVELYNQLQKINYTNHFILVIDNNSTDNSKEILGNHIPKDHLILNRRNTGYAGGNNMGIREAIKADADYVWILNPDIRVENNTLDILLNHIANDKKVAAIGPRICERNDKNLIYSDGGIIKIEKGFQTGHLNKGKRTHDINEDIDSKEVAYVNGSCMLINLSCIEHVGLLREDFFLYFEETEWSLRAKELGWKLLAVYKTKCYHLQSTKKLKYFYYMTRNRIYLSILCKKYISKTINLEINLILTYLLKLQLKIAIPKIFGLFHALLKLSIGLILSNIPNRYKNL